MFDPPFTAPALFIGDKMKKVAIRQLSWITGEGHTAKTQNMEIASGIITRVDVVASSVTDNPTLTLLITDTTNGGDVVPSVAAIPDGTHTILLARSNKATQDGDFNEVPISGDGLTVSIDPSADPGGVDQTLTVDVILYLEEDI